MDFLAGLPFDKVLDGGGWAAAFWVTFYVARMVYTGRLVPYKTHEGTVSALELERKRNEVILDQLERATDAMETFEAFVKALPQPSGGPPGPAGQVVRPARPRRGGRTLEPDSDEGRGRGTS